MLIEQKKEETSTEKIAILLHKYLCRHNHTDGCAWFYEVRGDNHDWSRPEHQKYYQKAIHLQQEFPNLSEEKIRHLLEVIRE